MPNVMAALLSIGATPSVQRHKVWLVPCSNTAKTRKPLKFAGGAPNSQTDLSH